MMWLLAIIVIIFVIIPTIVTVYDRLEERKYDREANIGKAQRIAPHVANDLAVFHALRTITTDTTPEWTRREAITRQAVLFLAENGITFTLNPDTPELEPITERVKKAYAIYQVHMRDGAVKPVRLPSVRSTGSRLKELRTHAWNLSGGQCQHCGATLNGGGWHMDHIIPLAKGGADTEANVQALCDGCNLRKGTRTDHPKDAGRGELSLIMTADTYEGIVERFFDNAGLTFLEGDNYDIIMKALDTTPDLLRLDLNDLRREWGLSPLAL